MEEVHDYIAADNEDLAIETVERILAGVEALGRHPQLGRAGRVRGTRELIVGTYLIAYRLVRDAVEIHSVLHGARRWPDRF
jgi:plasmid stabilization system protein ParE